MIGPCWLDGRLITGDVDGVAVVIGLAPERESVELRHFRSLWIQDLVRMLRAGRGSSLAFLK